MEILYGFLRVPTAPVVMGELTVVVCQARRIERLKGLRRALMQGFAPLLQDGVVCHFLG
jgi:hypothetical protein